LRKSRPTLKETPVVSDSGRRQVLVEMPSQARRLSLPKAVEIRHAAKKGRYTLGDAFVRDPMRTAAVKAELDRLHKLREKATEAAERKSPT
jgi:hypothetical protein